MPSNAVSNYCFEDPGEITNGQRVEAEVINPILRQLYENDLRLKAVQDYFEMPSALTACVDTAGDVAVGQPVYYNSSTSLYELARYSTFTAAGRTFLNLEANVWGLVVEKIAATRARILIDGIYEVDLTNAIGTATVDHSLYLSDEAGKLVQYPPDNVAPAWVGVGAGDGTVLFRPWMQDFSGIILQWKHHLLTQAAGDITITGNTVSITNADSGQIGWLPADDASFGGNAPAGAVFGYNIAADADLLDLWPPRFLNTVYAEFHRGGGPDGAQGLTVGSDGLIIVDENGIWWTSDCEEDAPFVTSAPSWQVTDCPKPTSKRVTIYAARPAGPYAGDLQAAGVRSLNSVDSFVRVRKRHESITANRGDLDLSVYWNAAFGQTTNDGSALAVKGSLGNKLSRGPVASRIKPGTGITLSSANGDATDGYYGDVTVSLSAASSGELLPLTTSLTGATEENEFGVASIGFPAARSSKVTSTFQVPSYLTSDVGLKLITWIAANYAISGSGSGPNEALQLEYRVIEPPTSPVSIASLSSSSIASIFVPVNHGVLTQQSSETITAPAGSIVSVTMTRSGDAYGYSLLMFKHFMQVTG